MTGGKVVNLGPAGRNFAAGMSGGVAYVLDEKGDFRTRCNLQMVSLEKLEEPAEVEEVRQMIERHAECTRSQRAWKILASWQKYARQFAKVMPNDYKRVLLTLEKMKQQGLSGEDAIMAAFEANARDEARLGGS